MGRPASSEVRIVSAFTGARRKISSPSASESAFRMEAHPPPTGRRVAWSPRPTLDQQSSEFCDDVNKKRQWIAFCAKNKSYIEKAEFKAVMEDIRNFLALPVRTVQKGCPFTKTWKSVGPWRWNGYQCTSFDEFSRLGTMRSNGFSLLFSTPLCRHIPPGAFKKNVLVPKIFSPFSTSGCSLNK
jgi:hypothetical protein